MSMPKLTKREIAKRIILSLLVLTGFTVLSLGGLSYAAFNVLERSLPGSCPPIHKGSGFESIFGGARQAQGCAPSDIRPEANQHFTMQMGDIRVEQRVWETSEGEQTVRKRITEDARKNGWDPVELPLSPIPGGPRLDARHLCFYDDDDMILYQLRRLDVGKLEVVEARFLEQTAATLASSAAAGDSVPAEVVTAMSAPPAMTIARSSTHTGATWIWTLRNTDIANTVSAVRRRFHEHGWQTKEQTIPDGVDIAAPKSFHHFTATGHGHTLICHATPAAPGEISIGCRTTTGE